MAGLIAHPDKTEGLARVDGQLLRLGVVGGLLGGAALFVVMAVYNAAKGMGFWSILNACFASFVYPNAGMTAPMGAHGTGSMMKHGMAGQGMSGHQTMTGHGMMTGGPIVASHLAVGTILHLAMSATAGVAFAVVLATLLRAGLRRLTNPLGYLAAGALGGGLLFGIMMYVVAPALNSEIVNFTPRVPFFLAHLLFGATVAGYLLWRTAPTTETATAGTRRAGQSPA